MKFNFMKQAQEMQKRLEEVQQVLDTIEVEGQAGGGAVKVTMTCKGEVRRVILDESLMNPQEREILEDLIVAALNDGRARGDARASEEMNKVTQGLSLPGGMKLPF